MQQPSVLYIIITIIIAEIIIKGPSTNSCKNPIVFALFIMVGAHSSMQTTLGCKQLSHVFIAFLQA